MKRPAAFAFFAIAALAAGATAAVAADCSSLTIGEILSPPMPEPMPGAKPQEPMPSAMAKAGETEGNVTAAAAAKKACMDQMLKQDQQTMDNKPAN
jgi:hypothetical protein